MNGRERELRLRLRDDSDYVAATGETCVLLATATLARATRAKRGEGGEVLQTSCGGKSQYQYHIPGKRG